MGKIGQKDWLVQLEVMAPVLMMTQGEWLRITSEFCRHEQDHWEEQRKKACSGMLSLFFFFFKLFIWLCQVIVILCRVFCWGERAQLPRDKGFLSSLTRVRTRIACIGRWILSYWTTREVPEHSCFEYWFVKYGFLIYCIILIILFNIWVFNILHYTDNAFSPRWFQAVRCFFAPPSLFFFLVTLRSSLAVQW